MTAGPAAVRPALSDGLKAGGPWLGALLLAGSWAVALLQPGGADAVRAVLHGSGAVIVAGGGVLLLATARPAIRPLQVALAALLLAGGFALVLRAVAGQEGTASFPLSAAKVAVLGFAVNAGTRHAPLVLGTLLVAAMEGLCAVGAPRLGTRWRPDLAEAAMLLLAVVVTVGLRAVTVRLADSRRAAAAAVEQEALTRTRALARSRAAAVVHDTVLGDLSALAAMPAGRLPSTAGRALAQTLQLLASPDWTSSVPTGPVPLPGGAVRAAVRRAERVGLAIRIEGDLTELGRLEAGADHALAQAVEQCLTNTRVHSGATTADLTVLGDPDAVTVLISDAGRGFEPAVVDADRLGLVNSVTGRVRAVGGTARVFTQPGVGTTVVLSVPAAPR